MKDSCKIVSALSILAFFLVAGFFLSATVKATQVNLTITPSDDAMVDQANPTINYGSAPYLGEKNINSPNLMRSFLKFALPNATTYQTVTLCAYAYSSYGAGQDGASRIYNSTNQTWAESSVTWNSGTNSGSYEDNSARSPGWQCIDVTGITKTYLNLGYTNGTYVLRSAQEGLGNNLGTIYYSKEYTINPSLEPYLLISYDRPSQYITYFKSSYCVNSTLSNGSLVQCTTPALSMPHNCIGLNVSLFSNITTSPCGSSDMKGIYQLLSDTGYTVAIQQNVFELCDLRYNKTLANPYLSPDQDYIGYGQCLPAANQNCAILNNVTASCLIKASQIDYLFSDPSSFSMRWGDDVSLYNEIQNNGDLPLRITMAVSDGNFMRIGDQANTNPGLYLPNFTSLSFVLAPGESYPFTAYISPSKYGGLYANGTKTLQMSASSNETGVAATKTYYANFTGQVFPVTVCGNGICEYAPNGNENNATCPQDCSAIPGGSGGPDAPWIDTGNSIVNVLLTTNSLFIIGSLVSAMASLYYIGKAMPNNQTVPMFAGALIFVVSMALGIYYGLVINWIGAILVIISGGFAISLVSKIMGIGGK
jgi:hypothetical protein